MLKGIVNKVIPFSSVDGPGTRFAILFQGCNFNCLYCHNPETIKRCLQCGTCYFNCPNEAISLVDKTVVWNESKCKNCGLCVKICKNNCGPKYKLLSVVDILKDILKVKPSLCGITVSGGECTLQSEFLVDLFSKVKKLDLSIFIHTNGSTDFEKNKELTNLIDMAMLDIKSFDPKEHKMLTGRDNEMVIKNAKYLGSINKLFEVRTVIVPDILNNQRNVDEISKLIVSLNPHIRYKLIKYKPLNLGEDKISYHVPTDTLMKELKEISMKNGCTNTIIV